eukprot:SAG22_NODE_650_length_8156_cov_10.637830_4_plen_229_part_00
MHRETGGRRLQDDQAEEHTGGANNFDVEMYLSTSNPRERQHRLLCMLEASEVTPSGKFARSMDATSEAAADGAYTLRKTLDKIEEKDQEIVQAQAAAANITASTVPHDDMPAFILRERSAETDDQHPGLSEVEKVPKEVRSPSLEYESSDVELMEAVEKLLKGAPVTAPSDEELADVELMDGVQKMLKGAPAHEPQKLAVVDDRADVDLMEAVEMLGKRSSVDILSDI